MSWIDDLGLRHFDEGGDTGDAGDSWSSWVSSPSYTQYTSNAESGGSDAVISALQSMSPEQSSQPTDQENMNAVIREIVQRDALKSGSGESWKSGSGADVLTGDAARMLQSGQLSWNDIIPTAANPNPDYRQWVAGDLPNGTPGYVDPKTGKWVYGTSRTGLSYDQLQAMQDQGQGNTQLTDNQNVDQALAAMEADKFLTKYAAPLATSLITALIPGGGLALSGIRQLQALQQGKTTPGAIMQDMALQGISSKIGLPYGVMQGVLKGSPEEAITSYATGRSIGEIASKIAEETKVPVPIVSQMLNEFGVTKDLKGAVTKVMEALRPGQ